MQCRWKQGVKMYLFSRKGQIFLRGRILIIFSENVKYKKLIFAKQLFSCKLLKTAPFWGIFPYYCSGRIPNPRQCSPWIENVA